VQRTHQETTLIKPAGDRGQVPTQSQHALPLVGLWRGSWVGGRAKDLIVRHTAFEQLEDEGSDMHETKHWNIAVEIDEYDGRTRAVARLRTDSAVLTGVGLARLSPHDRDVPEIGDELAGARALSELSHQLLETAAEDIEQITHQPARLHI
jgi:hypothetical protein